MWRTTAREHIRMPQKDGDFTMMSSNRRGLSLEELVKKTDKHVAYGHWDHTSRSKNRKHPR